MVEMTNSLLPADALLSRRRREVREILPGLKSVREPVDSIQNQLVGNDNKEELVSHTASEARGYLRNTIDESLRKVSFLQHFAFLQFYGEAKS